MSTTKRDFMEIQAFALLRGDRGGFAASLADAYLRADSGNRRKIETAFPDLFKKMPDAEAQELVFNSIDSDLRPAWVLQNIKRDDPKYESFAARAIEGFDAI